MTEREAAFRALMVQAFPEFNGIEIEDRHGDWVDLAFRSHAVPDLNARWRLTGNGSVGFVIQPFHSKREAVMLTDVALDAARFVIGSAALLSKLGWQGGLVAEATLVMLDRRVDVGSADSKHTLDGIVKIGERTNRGAGSWVDGFQSPSSVDVAEFVSELLTESLRTERRCELDYDRLLASLRTLVATI